jgi:hypothetical protein
MSFHPLTPDRDVNIKISQIEKRNKEKKFFCGNSNFSHEVTQRYTKIGKRGKL